MTLLLDVQELNIFIRQQQQLIPVVKHLNFQIEQGECVGIVGESGCGKSLTAQTIACLGSHPFTGKIYCNGQAFHEMDENEKRKICPAQIGMIFQNPQICLNPTMRIGKQIQEAGQSLTRQDVIHLMKQMGLNDAERCFQSYPHELSGGMCQRVIIAIALARKPQLIIADEPTTALDVNVQHQILSLLKQIRLSTQTSILLITHDFSVIESMCSRVLVMYAGEIVESGSVDQVLNQPLHPYTQALLSSRPRLGLGKDFRLPVIPGRPPKITERFSGCSFAARCQKPFRICVEKKTPLKNSKFKNSQVACWQYFNEEEDGN